MSPPDDEFHYGECLHHGFQFGFVVLAFLLIGWWLDTKLGTSPVALIICVFFGAAAGLYSLYQHLFGKASAPPKK